MARVHRLGVAIPLCVLAAAALAACADSRPRRVSESGYGAFEVSLAVQPHRIAVAWYDTRDGNAEIYLRLLNRRGDPQGDEHRLTHDPEDSYEVDIDAIGDGFAVAWYDKDAESVLRAKLAFWHPEQGFRWRVDLAPRARSSRNPVIDVFADRIFCAWIEQDGEGAEVLRAAWWSLDGHRLGAPAVLAPVGPTTWNLNAALDDAGRAYVVFDAAVDTVEEELYLARLDGAESERIRLTDDDGYRSKYPDLALAGQRAALTWFDERDGNREVYLFAGTIAELDASLEQRARRITHTPGESIGAYVAWNRERIGLAWTDEIDGVHDLHFQSFDADGTALSGIQRITRTPARSSIPAIRPWRSGFAVAWNEVVPGPSGLYDLASKSEVELVFLP